MADSLIVYEDFSGGVNTRLPSIIGDSVFYENKEYPACYFGQVSTNFWTLPSGLCKVGGYSQLGSTTLNSGARINGIFEYWSGSNLTLIVCAGSKIYSMTTAGVATEIHTGLTGTTARMKAARFNDVLIMCNGVDVPHQYDGSTVSSITFTGGHASVVSGFKPAGIAVANGVCYYYGDTSSTFLDKIAIPDAGSYINFTSSNTSGLLTIETNNGGNITHIEPFVDQSVIIYKERCIRRLNGNNIDPAGVDPFQLTPVTDQMGCLSPFGVAKVGTTQYFLWRDGIRTLKPSEEYGGPVFKYPGYKVPDLVAGINQSYTPIRQSQLVYDQKNQRLVLTYPAGSSSTNDSCVEFEVQTESWMPRGTGITSAFMGFVNGVLMHGGYNGKVYQHLVTDDDYAGTNYVCTWESKYIAHQGFSVLKDYKRLTFYFESDQASTVIASWEVIGAEQITSDSDSGSTGSGALWDNALWDNAVFGGQSYKAVSFKNVGSGNAIKMMITVPTTTIGLPKICRIELEYAVLGTRIR